MTMIRKSWRLDEPWRSVLYLALLQISRVCLQIFLYQIGFISVSADEFARGLIAGEWALHPRFNLAADMGGIWLPFEKYLNGSILLIWPDVIWAPRLTVFFFSCCLVVVVYLLVYRLFENFSIAVLASFFLVFQPWFVWLSGTPMLDMYFLACFFTGLLFLMVWFRRSRSGYWFWAGVCFFFSSGFHLQGWLAINLVNLLTLIPFYQALRNRDFPQVFRLIGFYILGNSFILLGSAVEFLQTGHILAFVSNHTSYAQWFYHGYNISSLRRFLYYPGLIYDQSSRWIWIFIVLAIFFLWQEKGSRWKLLPILMFGLLLGAYSVENLISIPATAAPERYSLIFVILLSPYIAYGVYRLWYIFMDSSQVSLIRFLGILLVVLFPVAVEQNIARVTAFPAGISLDAVEVGRQLRTLLDNTSADSQSKYMVELRYWDFLAVRLTAGHYTDYLYDREYNLRNRNTLSIFEQDADVIYACLAAQNVRYVVLGDPILKQKAQSLGFLEPRVEVGEWVIYQFRPYL
jgi:hypothetical protein